MHTENCFITLTYDDDNLPYPGTLLRKDFTNFVKRLRKKLSPEKFRLFYCGEYGEETARPHYHALMFGYRPPDPELFSQQNEIRLYGSKSLRETWGMGHATFGDLTFESAAYVARYCTKKITGPQAEDHYTMIDPDTGEVWQKLPEFSGMSLKPGIGLPWLKRYGTDSYEKDEIILRDKAMKPPRAYDNAFEVINPQLWATVKSKRSKLNFEKFHPVNLDPEIRQSRRDHAANIILHQKLKMRKEQ